MGLEALSPIREGISANLGLWSRQLSFRGSSLGQGTASNPSQLMGSTPKLWTTDQRTPKHAPDRIREIFRCLALTAQRLRADGNQYECTYHFGLLRRGTTESNACRIILPYVRRPRRICRRAAEKLRAMRVCVLLPRLSNSPSGWVWRLCASPRGHSCLEHLNKSLSIFLRDKTSRAVHTWGT